MGPKGRWGTSQKKFLMLLLEASSALVLPPQVVELPGQPLDGSGDVTDIIAGDGSLAIGGHGSGLCVRLEGNLDLVGCI